jgi:hypothetical protein
MKKILKVYFGRLYYNSQIKLTDIRGKIINTKDMKIKIIQKILNKK